MSVERISTLADDDELSPPFLWTNLSSLPAEREPGGVVGDDWRVKMTAPTAVFDASSIPMITSAHITGGVASVSALREIVAFEEWDFELELAAPFYYPGVDAALPTAVEPDTDAWIRRLDAACREAAVENWDGEGGRPVQPGALAHAMAFVRSLPDSARQPDVSIDPDGEMALSWHDGEDVVSVSISGTGRLSYAGLFGESDSYGTEWMGAEAPREIALCLDRLLPATDPSHRTG